MGPFTNSVLAISALDARLDDSFFRGDRRHYSLLRPPPVASAITPHVIEALLSDGVEPVQKTGMRTRDVGAAPEHRTGILLMERFILRQLSRFPVSASLWTDFSPANVVVTAVAIITSHVIELVSRSRVSELIRCITR
jgi:hypothetical protein